MLQRQYDRFISGEWPAGPNNLYSGNFSVPRERLMAAGGFNLDFTRQEDVELGYRLARIGLQFQFNPRANGIHRPNRSFAGWYRSPYEYGRRDVQMARDLGEPRGLENARDHWRERNRLTHFMARAAIGVPVIQPIVLAAGRLAVQCGSGRPAMKACSALFNLRYLQGMASELGNRTALWRALADPVGMAPIDAGAAGSGGGSA